MADDVQRRLAAILSADAVGYSRLMAADEQATVRTITACRREIARLIDDHRGRVVDATGDNVLAEFATALDAVESAVEVQQALRTRNADLAVEERMEFRIGVHLGDVVVEGERIYGDGVNIAARLEGLARPGGIIVSGAVHDQVESKLSLGFEDLGRQPLKNIPRSVRVIRILNDAPFVGGSRARASQTSVRPSIAVLPFADMSPERDQEYFCDGMAEEVINALTQLEGLHVVARTSAFSFKGRDVDVRKIGSELGVRSVLEGSVRKAGDRLRVTAQLINVEDGYQMWSKRFDRTLDDVFAVQDEISASIVDTLESKLVTGPTSSSTKRTTNREAYDLYLRGMTSMWQHTEPAYERAVADFECCLELDPEFAAAHAALSLVCNQMNIYGFWPADRVQVKAEKAALRAVELDGSLAEAHHALANVRTWLHWDWQGAAREYRRAIELNPGYAYGRSQYVGGYLTPMGQREEALAEIRRAHELDPLARLTNRILGETLYMARRYDDAIRQFELTLEMFPDLYLAHNLLALAYASNNMPEESMRARQQMFLSVGREQEAQALGAAFAQEGEAGMLQWQIERASSRVEVDGSEGVSGARLFNLALLNARLGEAEEAFRWLEEAIRHRGGTVIFVRVHPWLDSLRDEQRYEQLLRRMNLA